MAEKKKPELCPREVLAAGRKLIDLYHPHLEDAEVRFVFMPRMSRHGRTLLGKATTLGGLAHLLSGANFVICLNHEEWPGLSAEKQAALLDHQLCHCGPLDGDAWTVRDHDLDEFKEIVTRHGLWDGRLDGFVEHLVQLGLFSALVEPAMAGV